MSDIRDLLRRSNVLDEIAAERKRQDARFGPAAGFADDPEHVKLTVLMKKVADYAVAIGQPEAYFGHLPQRNARQELVELAAVCVALLEATDG